MTAPTERTPSCADAYEAHLAPWAARGRTSRGRIHPEAEHPYRSVYQRDRDRIIHSAAFRRLEYKTQVFVNHEGDHYRTRLTHTLEVAQIGRSLARALDLNEDLTEAIALAHDLGHTPFGHSGEEALNLLMADHGGFEHNAQGLRIVDHLESRYPDFPGLNLSYEVREGFASHSTRHDFPRAREGFPEDERPPLEAQVVEVADEIAYDNHDLDDGLTSGILDENEVADLAIWREACPPEANELPTPLRWAQTIRRLINMEATDVIEETRRRVEAAGAATLDDVRAHPRRLVGASERLTSMKDELEAFLAERLYNYYTVRRMANKAKRFVRDLYTLYMDDPRMLPEQTQAQIERWGPARTTADYIAAMTDRYAQEEYQRLFNPFERM